MKASKSLRRLREISVPLRFYDLDWGGERYLKTGETIPTGGVEELRKFDAIFLGAIGHPAGEIGGYLEQGNPPQAEVRARSIHQPAARETVSERRDAAGQQGPAEIDFVIVRENVKGFTSGSGGNTQEGHAGRGRHPGDGVHAQRSGALRRFAFELTRKRNRAKKLTLSGKTNVLTFAQDLWFRTFKEVAKNIRT